tara:strand:+ start:8242 stop:8460 length:219 start_codon:yes stop_codon:yes gene_type:complete
MRQIKFRGKRIDNGEWIEGCLIYNIDPHTKEDTVVEDEVWIREPLRNLSVKSKVHPSTVGQFTGLKDKKGKL